MMRTLCRAHCVDCHLRAAIGAVLETNRTGESGCKLAMTLAFGGACTNRAPAHQVRNILRADQVELFVAGGNAHRGEIE